MLNECQCPLAGWCETHRRTMSESRHRECQTDPRFFDVFQNDLARRLDRGEDPQPPAVVDAPKRNSKPRMPAALECVHRGDVLRKGKADLCGRKGEVFNVFACAVHGECAIGRYCKKQKEMACVTCGDRQEA